MAKTYKGFYKPKNPKKYKGDPTNIIYRSWWEYRVMHQLDMESNVIWWQSEEITIPYKSPVDNAYHRYYVDFVVKTKSGKTILIEVKPLKQTEPPVLKEGVSPRKRSYIKEVMTYGINTAKWKAARAYCKENGFEFWIVTENELGSLKF